MIVIDTDNYKASGIDAFFFPGGEPHAKIPVEVCQQDHIIFNAKLRSWNDIGLLMSVLITIIDAVYQLGIDTPRVYMAMGYFPGARQDRNPITDGIATPPTRDVMAAIFGELNTDFPGLVFDLHSPMEPNEDIPLPPQQFGYEILNMDVFGDDLTGIVVPDKGAVRRCQDFAQLYTKHYDRHLFLVQGDKKRDFTTGAITGYELSYIPKPGRYLVVDDICDGGWTFTELAQTFQGMPNGDQCTLELYVSHGIFSKGVDLLCNYFTKIYTTDTFCVVPDDWMGKVTIIPVQDKLVQYIIDLINDKAA